MNNFKTPVVNNNSISFAGLLTILFITLKLTKVITWSWWWVLCPLWIGFVILALIFVIAMVIGVIFALFES